MNIRAFFGEALSQALELGIGTPEDVMQHVTPQLLAQHLPRPLWARLFTACLGAPRVDAQLVVETIGVPNMCEHIPSQVIWQVISQIAVRSLAQASTAPAAQPIAARSAPTEKRSVLSPPPERIAGAAPALAASAAGPSIPPVNEPLADLISELEQDDRPITPTRIRTPTSQRFRQSNTGVGRLGANAAQQRRPQAAVPMPAPAAPAMNADKHARRGGTEVEDGGSTDVLHGDGLRASQREIAVDDSQLVDWQSTETTQAAVSDEDFGDIGRKR